jgi:hypothetical protein
VGNADEAVKFATGDEGFEIADEGFDGLGGTFNFEDSTHGEAGDVAGLIGTEVLVAADFCEPLEGVEDLRDGGVWSGFEGAGEALVSLFGVFESAIHFSELLFVLVVVGLDKSARGVDGGLVGFVVLLDGIDGGVGRFDQLKEAAEVAGGDGFGVGEGGAELGSGVFPSARKRTVPRARFCGSGRRSWSA